MSSLYEEEQLNTSNNLTTKLHNNETANYHHFNGQNKQINHLNQVQSIDHKNEISKNNDLANSRINQHKGHLLLKNDASDGSNSNTLIDSDVSNSSNSFASS